MKTYIFFLLDNSSQFKIKSGRIKTRLTTKLQETISKIIPNIIKGVKTTNNLISLKPLNQI